VRFATSSGKNIGYGTLTIFLIPTTLVSALTPFAEVQLCDVGLRIKTFTKQKWGKANSSGIHKVTMLDNRVTDQINPDKLNADGTKGRVRSLWDDDAVDPLTGQHGAFVDADPAFPETESVRFAVHTPTGQTLMPRPDPTLYPPPPRDWHWVDKSGPLENGDPFGGPASVAKVENASSGAEIVSRIPIFDQRRGKTDLDCDQGTGSDDPDPKKALCADLHAALNLDPPGVVGSLVPRGSDLLPTMGVNGRFLGEYAIDHAAIAAAVGVGVNFDLTEADNCGASDGWSGGVINAQNVCTGGTFVDANRQWRVASDADLGCADPAAGGDIYVKHIACLSNFVDDSDLQGSASFTSFLTAVLVSSDPSVKRSKPI
jgi:hypothetical protein